MTGAQRTAVGTSGPAADVGSPAPPPEHRRPDIQGLRAVAVLLVVAFHAGLWVPGGFTGVDVFFVISGFVITAMLLREFGTSGGLSFRAFYARRVRRILPASALTISVVALASIAAISPSAQETTAHTGVAGSMFVANVLLARARTGYFDVAPNSNPLLHIWSLSVEEQFYLVFPALLVAGFFVARRGFPRSDPRRIVGTIVGTIALVSFAVSWYATSHTFTAAGIALDPQMAFYLAPTRAWEFAVGALLAIGVPQISRLPRAVAIACAWIGAAGVGAAAWWISSTTPFPGTAALLPVGGSALLLIAGTASRNPISWVLSLRPVTKIGDLSYSWYLWHWPLIVFALALFPMEEHAALIAAVISIIPAWLSFKYFETPMRLNTQIQGRRAVAVAVVCIVVPVGCSLVLLRAPRPPQSAATKALLVASARAHQTELRRCNLGTPLAALPARCTWSVPNPHGRVVLLGDSNAGHFVEPAAAAANGLGFNLTVDTYPECPFVDLIVDNPTRRSTTQVCQKFVTESLQELLAERPSLVVLAASGPLYLLSRATFREPGSRSRAATPNAKAALWSRGLTRVLAQLAAAKVPTVVIHTIPQWKTWDTRSCAEVRVYLDPLSCGTTQTRAEVDAFRRRSREADDQALRAVPSAVGIDFVGDLCHADGCATNRGNVWLYKDGRHLSVTGARTLTDRFHDVIRAHAHGR